MNKKIVISAIIVAIIIISVFVWYAFYNQEEECGSSAKGDVEYKVTFKSTWSESTHPYNFPDNPHFSDLIGGTHNGSVYFWREGELASPGIKNMAEKGRVSPLDNEIKDAISAKTAFSKIKCKGISKSPGSRSMTFQLKNNYTLVTLVSMIAPSPDWFVGVSGLNLYEDGEWVTEKVVDLYLYDAGTDSGEEHTSQDVVTTPPESITMINETVLPGSSIPYGTFAFIKQ